MQASCFAQHLDPAFLLERRAGHVSHPRNDASILGYRRESELQRGLRSKQFMALDVGSNTETITFHGALLS